MKSLNTILKMGVGVGLLSLAFTGSGFAQEAEVAEAVAEVAPAVSDDVAYVFNTFLFLVCGFLVMWMAAGFCMLEAGLVRSRNVATICLKNISLYSISGLMYWLIGYNLMYGVAEGGYLGSFAMWSAGPADAGDGYAAGSDWFFQMVFCATTASIVSGRRIPSACICRICAAAARSCWYAGTMRGWTGWSIR